MAATPKFVELNVADGCGTCAFCTGPSPEAQRAAPTGQSAQGRAGRTRAAGALLAIATGVVGIEAGTTTSASALPAPSREGWDGTRYWFKSQGQWRWTSHQSVYLQRTGGTGGTSKAAAPAPVRAAARTTASEQAWLPAPSRAGWDGTRYWFKSQGQWRWTSHQSVYLQRTGGTAGAGGTASTGGTATAPAKTPASPKGNTASLEPVLAYALAQLGKPYIWGGNGPTGYDCSGLVQQAYRRAGISLPRVASDQYGATTKISSSSLRRGDLLFWSSNGRQSGVHHVAVYLGGGRYVEAPRPGKNVRVSPLSNGYPPTLFGRP